MFSETSPPETSSSSTPSSSSTSAVKKKDETAKTSEEFRLPDATVETEEQCKLGQFERDHHNDYSGDPKTGDSKSGFIQKPDIFDVRILNGKNTKWRPKTTSLDRFIKNFFVDIK